MKKLILLIASASFILISCNSNSSNNEEQSKMESDNGMQMPNNENADKEVKLVSASFTNIDPAVGMYLKSLLQNYLELKNALTNSNEAEAAKASAKITGSMKGFDKSLLTAEQKIAYDKIESDLKEQALQIANGKIDIQRAHFSNMSTDVYEMVKAFGAGMTLYHDYCPMANDNQGAMWLSETKNIRNPYFGDEMMTCGTVEEMFQ